MSHSLSTVALLGIALLASCTTKDTPTHEMKPSETTAITRTNVYGTEKNPPGRIKVAHVLIAFQGSGTAATRTKEEAEALASEIFKAAQAGEDFDKLMKKSDDNPTGGKYGMFTDPKLQKPGDFPRRGMVPAFGNIGFTLKLNEVGLAVFHPTDSPFGWHIVKRIE